jgi:hypothetical protein
MFHGKWGFLLNFYNLKRISCNNFQNNTNFQQNPPGKYLIDTDTILYVHLMPVCNCSILRDTEPDRLVRFKSAVSGGLFRGLNFVVTSRIYDIDRSVPIKLILFLIFTSQRCILVDGIEITIHVFLDSYGVAPLISWLLCRK